MTDDALPLITVGSVAYDDVETPAGIGRDQLGGSAVYFSFSASYFCEVGIVGVVGEDFADEDRQSLIALGVDLSGLETKQGSTFRWAGHYMEDVNTAVTLSTRLNVFETFNPKLYTRQSGARHLFLANIDPTLQITVLENMAARPRLVACDTMNLWIENERAELLKVISRADVIMLNEGEARQLTGMSHLPSAAAEILKMSEGMVVIKRGEYGSVLFGRDFTFAAPAYPLNEVIDPTGAGDTFAGGFLGWLTAEDRIDEETLRRAVIFGSVMASFAVENFGTRGLIDLEWSSIMRRFDEFTRLTLFTPPQGSRGRARRNYEQQPLT